MIHDKINYKSYYPCLDMLVKLPYDTESGFFVSWLKGMRVKPYFKNNYKTN